MLLLNIGTSEHFKDPPGKRTVSEECTKECAIEWALKEAFTVTEASESPGVWQMIHTSY